MGSVISTFQVLIYLTITTTYKIGTTVGLISQKTRTEIQITELVSRQNQSSVLGSLALEPVLIITYYTASSCHDFITVISQ